MSQTREETLIRAGLGPPRRPQARGLSADRPASPERSCDLPARTPLLLPPQPWAHTLLPSGPAPPASPRLPACLLPPLLQPPPTPEPGDAEAGCEGPSRVGSGKDAGRSWRPLPAPQTQPGSRSSSHQRGSLPAPKPTLKDLAQGLQHPHWFCLFSPKTGNAWDKFL